MLRCNIKRTVVDETRTNDELQSQTRDVAVRERMGRLGIMVGPWTTDHCIHDTTPRPISQRYSHPRGQSPMRGSPISPHNPRNLHSSPLSPHRPPHSLIGDSVTHGPRPRYPAPVPVPTVPLPYPRCERDDYGGMGYGSDRWRTVGTDIGSGNTRRGIG